MLLGNLLPHALAPFIAHWPAVFAAGLLVSLRFIFALVKAIPSIANQYREVLENLTDTYWNIKKKFKVGPVECKRGVLAVFALGTKCAVERPGCVHDAG